MHLRGVSAPLTMAKQTFEKMPDNKDYSQLSLEELQQAEKKIKTMEITGAVFVGFCIGVMIFGLVMNGFGVLYTVIPLFLIIGVARNSQKQKEKLKELRAEIAGRGGE